MNDPGLVGKGFVRTSGGAMCDARLPKTCGFLKQIFSNMEKNQGGGQLSLHDAVFSILPGPAWIRPHCGTRGDILTQHITISAPSDKSVKMRVVNKSISFSPASSVVFDDSFEHEVRHPGGQPRVTLMLFLLL